MRSILWALSLMLGGAGLCMAQDEAYRGDAAATYHWVRTNAAPGDCGCFSLNGFGFSGTWNFHGPWSVVTDFGAEFNSSVPANNSSLSVISFLAGARYRVPQPWKRSAHSPQPFAQALIGPAHGSGAGAGVADGTTAFAARIGGGIDIPLRAHFQVRAFQADWFRTQFPNTVNGRQNNLLISAGITYHWSRAK